jgi:two-component system cell cycle sensor histidine kinase/response regulator CckA
MRDTRLETYTSHDADLENDELLKYRALTESLLDCSADGILVLDRYGIVENLNQLAQILLGRASSEAIGKSVSDVFLAFDPETDEPIDLSSDEFRNPKLSKLSSTRAYLLKPDGSRASIAFQLKPKNSSDPDRPELSGALLFVTDQSQTEYKEAQIRLIATALKSIGEGVIITDKNWAKGDARILYVNDGFSEISGYTEIDVVGKGISLLHGKNTDFSIVEEMVLDIQAGRTAAGEMVGYKKDGTEFIMAWKVFPVYASGAEITNYVVIQRDVSQIRRLEQDLFQSQKMEAVGRLAGGIAHDFNNILAVILSFSDLILESKVEEDTNAKYLKEIRKAAEKATDLTQQLLSFSRRNKNLKPEVLDAIKVAQDMQKILRRLIPEDIEFAAQFSPTPVHVNLNRTALEQILINFTTNARDAMPNGGKISLSISACSAEEAAKHLPEHFDSCPCMLLSFQDSGMGIDEATQERIFEPFFTTKDTGKGTGLGLSTVYGIVRQANGHIELTSEIGKGTRFRLFLPQVAAKEIETKNEGAIPPASNLSSSNRETILVVEDDETMCDCISGLLVYHNYEVFSTNLAEDAIEFFDESNASIQLLITDLILPKMRGSELAERLVKKNPDMKVIFMTGYSEDVYGQFKLPKNATVLKKPFSLKGALATVQKLLHGDTKQS